MRKLFAVLISVSIAVSLLCGCGGSNADAADQMGQAAPQGSSRRPVKLLRERSKRQVKPPTRLMRPRR